MPVVKSSDSSTVISQLSAETHFARVMEETIREWSGHYKKRTLWENLPDTIGYNQYNKILDHLIEKKKVAIDSEGHICWIFDPELFAKYICRQDLKI